MSDLRYLLPPLLGVLAGVGLKLGFSLNPDKSKTTDPPAAAGSSLQQKPATPTPAKSGANANSNEPTAASLAAGSLTTAAEMLARIVKADAADLPGLFEAMEKLPLRSVERKLVEAACFQRWVELGPEAGLAWLQSSGRQDAIPRMSARWLRSDPLAASAWLEKKDDIMLKIDLHLSQSGSDEELKNILTLSSAMSGSGKRLRSYRRTLVTMAARDPAWAMAFYTGTAWETGDAENAVRATASGMSLRGARQGFDWAKSLPEGKLRDSALRSALEYGSQADPGLVKELLGEVKLPDGLLVEARGKVAMHLARQSLGEALKFSKTLADGSLEERGMALQLKCRPGMDLLDLHALLADLSRAGCTPDSLRLGWAGRDQMADAAQLAAMPESLERDWMLAELTTAMGMTGGYRQVAKIAALPPGVRDVMARELMQIALNQGDSKLAGNYWTLIPDKDRGVVLQNIAMKPMTVENRTMLDQWLPTLSLGEQFGVRDAMARSMAYHDPPAALAWVASLPEAEQVPGVRNIATVLAREDEAATAQWVDAMPPGPVRDAAVGPLVSQLARVEPESALAWARSIGGEEARLKAMVSLGTFLMTDNTEAALAMADRGGLPEAEQKAFLQGIKEAGVNP